MQRLLVSVRGPNEAVDAANGGPHIADVEFPASDGLHSIGKEVWMVGSVIREQMAPLWATGADVICVGARHLCHWNAQPDLVTFAPTPFTGWLVSSIL